MTPPKEHQRKQESCCDTPSPPVEVQAEAKGHDEYFPRNEKEVDEPRAEHRWSCDQSVLSLATGGQHVYAGTEDGQICVYDLSTWQLVKTVQAHQGGVGCLAIASKSGSGYLVSGGTDSLIRVWGRGDGDEPLKEVYTVYSLFDIGDVFSLAWSERTHTLYFGCQNASVQWIGLKDARATADGSGLPAMRSHKFFDSTGPGGRMTPQQQIQEARRRQSFNQASQGGDLLEVPPENVLRFAHNGYVYAMTVCTLHDGTEVLVSGGGDGTVKMWDQVSVAGTATTTLQLRGMFETEGHAPVMSLAAAGSYLYCGLAHGCVVLYDLETKQTRRVDKFGDADILTLCHTGHTLFKGTRGRAQTWDPESYARCEWVAHKDLTLASAFSTDGNKRRLVTAGNDGTVAVWRVDEPDHSSRGQIPQALDNDQMVKTLGELVSYKTVSNQSGTNWFDSRKCAAYLQSLLAHFGADAKLLPVEPSRNPVVYARFRSNSPASAEGSSKRKKAHVVFYGHYDVITASSRDSWDTDPFRLTSADGYLYGRGASDNKGPVLAAIFAAAELFQAKTLDNDITFVIEGEEECGSVGFTDTILAHRKDLFGDVDWILLSNSYWIDDVTPCLNYGLRGVVNLSIRIRSDRPDLHSGVHGGVHREPAADMVALLARLQDPVSGRVLVPDFYKNIRPVVPAEERLYDAIVSTPNLNLTKEMLMKKWRYPSLTIHGIDASGPRNATIIPACISARLSVRIVPDQSLDEIKQLLDAYLRDVFAQLNSPNHLEVEYAMCADPWIGHPSNHAFQVLRQGIQEEWGVDPLFIREGGSIPVVRRLERILGAPAAQLPCGQASDGAHLNNERLRVLNFFKTRTIIRKAFDELRPRDPDSPCGHET